MIRYGRRTGGGVTRLKGRQVCTDKVAAWQRDGVPFHVWLISQACEILNVIFAMN
jgi:hypothetical protein